MCVDARRGRSAGLTGPFGCDAQDGVSVVVAETLSVHRDGGDYYYMMAAISMSNRGWRRVGHCQDVLQGTEDPANAPDGSTRRVTS